MINILTGVSAIIFHEIGHIIVAKKYKIFKGFKFKWLGLAIDLKDPINEIIYLKILCLGIIFGFIPFFIIFFPINLTPSLIFYLGCCIPDFINIFKSCRKVL